MFYYRNDAEQKRYSNSLSLDIIEYDSIAVISMYIYCSWYKCVVLAPKISLTAIDVENRQLLFSLRE
jgi:hypothetical protein